LGFAAREVVYHIIGLLAVQIALGDAKKESADKQGALALVADQPFGRTVLVVLAVGLAGYSLWRFSEALWGHVGEHDERKGVAKQLVSAGKGALYAVFCWKAISFVLSSSKADNKGSNGSQTEHSWTASVLGWPGGRFLVGVAGLAVAAGGLYLLWRGVTQKFEKKLDMSKMSRSTKRLTEVLGTVGSAARGAVFTLAGLLLIKAAFDFDPNEAQGLDGTLRAVAGQTHGQVLLLFAAVGLVVFGVYSFFEARYRKLHT
jgi:hypothetical protein